MKKSVTFKTKFNRDMTLAERVRIVEQLLKVAEKYCKKCDMWRLG